MTDKKRVLMQIWLEKDLNDVLVNHVKKTGGTKVGVVRVALKEYLRKLR